MCYLCKQQGTAEVLERRCSLCGEREHGSIACYAVGRKLELLWENVRVNVSYRVIDDRLFVVDPGSPPRQ